ncbi:glycosyltransferase [Sphingomonas sp. NFR15]|uniref:glycosyltransferase n=1 Tax=Sphingomonas sp. NFR15 TaxID=1566282 RepID=UPI0015A027F1|nr:glycosyltransferase [Sphingomonas sp. NFR15]
MTDPDLSLAPPRTVSIVIATAGRAVSLDRTLLSLRQLRHPLFEAIVVLGPSPDDSKEIVARHGDFVRLAMIDRLNLSAARNIGLSMARGDIVAFIDDDAIPEPDWLDLLLTGYKDPNVAQVGGFIRDNRGVDFQAKYLVVDRFGDSVDYEGPPQDLGDDLFLALTGTNFSARRKRLLEIGGFDEEYAYFLDETDVTVRLHDRGWGSAIVPEAEIHHKYEASHMRTATRVPRTMYPTARSKAYFCCVHGGRRRPLYNVMAYLADFVRKERAWKNDLFRYGHADQATIERLIEEVEQGVRDGVRDAFYHHGPQGLLADGAADSAGDSAEFLPFPLPLSAQDRLRLCFLSQDYPPVGSGGIGQWTREMAIGLAARGHEVTVICRSETDYPYIDFIEGVWVHRIVVGPADPAEAEREDVPLALLNYSASVAAEIERIQARRQFQVVCGPIFDLEPLAALRCLDIPTVVSLQTTYKLALPHKPDWLSNDWYRKSHVDKVIAKEKELLETAPFILANTSGLVSDLETSYAVSLKPDRVMIVPHGIKDLARGVEPMAAKPGVVKLLFVGRLELRKGADLLLNALPSLLRDHPQLEVDIVGDDSLVIDGETLRQRYEARWRDARVDTERVAFHGAVSRADLLRHYASCDIFVAPSRYESFGLIYVEAMIFAKPVIGLAVGGVVDVVAQGVNGFLLERDDPALLSEAIGRLVKDPAARMQMGRAGRDLYEQKFNIEKMVDGTVNCFIKVACAR